MKSTDISRHIVQMAKNMEAVKIRLGITAPPQHIETGRMYPSIDLQNKPKEEHSDAVVRWLRGE